MRRWLALWWKDWPVVRLRHARPDLAHVPIGVFLLDQGKPRIHCCCPEAKALGITSGMPLAEATAIAAPFRRRPAVHFQREDPVLDRDALAGLARWCQRFTPLVSIEEGDRPASLFLDITGCALRLGGEDKLLAQLRRGLAERSLGASAAIADSLSAAWAIARFGRGPAIIPPGQTRGILDPLPIAALRLPAETAALLAELGIERIGQLARLPRGGLATRLGPGVLERLDQATAQVAEIVLPHRPLPFAQAAIELEYPLERLEHWEPVLERLLEQLWPAVPPGNGIGHLSLQWRRETANSTATPAAVSTSEASSAAGWDLAPVAIDLFQPSRSTQHLLELLRLRLERPGTREILAGPLIGARLVGSAFDRLEFRQRELFETENDSGDSRLLGNLLDRLTSRLGEGAVGIPRLVPGPMPEWAFRLVPPSIARSERERHVFRLLPHPRPLRLAPSPLPVRSLLRTGTGPPARFQIAGEAADLVVERAWGPERLETGWWRRSGGAEQRDYFRVETTTGRRLWLFERAEGSWFLHGWLD